MKWLNIYFSIISSLISAQAMIVTGEHSPHLGPSEALFHHLMEIDRKKYSILKPDCGPSVLEEKVSC